MLEKTIMKSEMSEKKFKGILWFIFFILLANILVVGFYKSFFVDELEAIHTAYKVSQGQIIYIDFFQHHHPLFYYLAAPIFWILSKGAYLLIIFRFASIILFLLMLFVVYKLAKTIFDKTTALISLIFLITTVAFANHVMEVRPDIPQVLCGLISVLFLIFFFQKKSTKHLLLSSLFLGFSFLFLQKAIFLIFLVGLMLLTAAFKREISYRHVFIYGAAFIVTVFPYYSYLIANGFFKEYFFFNWIFNMGFLKRISFYGNFFRIFIYNIMLWIFWLVGLAFFLKTPNQKRIGWLSAGLLISVSFFRTPYVWYFLPILPFVSIVAAWAICSIYKKNREVLIIILIISIICSVYYIIDDLRAYSHSRQLAKVEYVLSITDKNDYVFDAGTLANVFRRDLDFFWFSFMQKGALQTYQKMRGYDYDVYKLIEELKPKIITVAYDLSERHPVIANNYIRCKGYSRLFIRRDKTRSNDF